MPINRYLTKNLPFFKGERKTQHNLARTDWMSIFFRSIRQTGMSTG